MLLRKAVAAVILLALCSFAFYAYAQTDTEGQTKNAADPALTAEDVPAGAKEEVTEQEPFTVVWIADTQNIVGDDKTYFQDMTRWTEANRQSRNILCLIHTGDLSENLSLPSQHKLVNAAFDELKQTPVLVVAGNHDFGKKKSDFRPFYYLPVVQKFPKDRVLKDGHGFYSLYQSGQTEILVVGLSYGTAGYQSAQKWARDIFLAHPDAVGIFVTHQFVTREGIVLPDNPFVTDIIAQCPNIRLVLCGHSRCIAHTEIRFRDDPASEKERVVNVLCFDYQLEDPLKGSYMQLLSFDPADRSISLITYSPTLDDYICYDDRPDEENFILNDAF